MAILATSPVHHRLRQRQRLGLHALLLHHLQARLQIHKPGSNRPGRKMPVPKARSARGVFPLQSMGQAPTMKLIEPRLGEPVRMNIHWTTVASRRQAPVILREIRCVLRHRNLRI